MLVGEQAPPPDALLHSAGYSSLRALPACDRFRVTTPYVPADGANQVHLAVCRQDSFHHRRQLVQEWVRPGATRMTLAHLNDAEARADLSPRIPLLMAIRDKLAVGFREES